MLGICSRNHSWLVKASLVLFLACGPLTSVQAQTADETIAKLSPSLSPNDAEIQKLVIRGYEAYATKAVPALLSMFSQQSPYLDQFKAFLTEENAANQNGVWKIWQFIDTAEELTAELLAAPTDEARALVLQRSEPFTDGLLKGLSNVGAELLYKKGNDDQAAMILNIVLTIAMREKSELG